MSHLITATKKRLKRARDSEYPPSSLASKDYTDFQSSLKTFQLSKVQLFQLLQIFENTFSDFLISKQRFLLLPFFFSSLQINKGEWIRRRTQPSSFKKTRSSDIVPLCTTIS